MVDSISSNNGNNINELHTNPLLHNNTVERVNSESASAADKGTVLPFGDKADISDEARAQLEAERGAMKFASLASRMDEPFDSEKVSHFKAMLDSGRINEYLRGVGNDTLAEALLADSPIVANLR